MYQVNIFTATRSGDEGAISVAILECNGHQKVISSLSKDKETAELSSISKAVSSLKRPEQTAVRLYSLQDLAYLLRKDLPQARELKEKLKRCRRATIAKNVLRYRHIFNEARIIADRASTFNKGGRMFTWKNKTPPTPEEVESSPSLEHFLLQYLESPDYGTREKITEIPLIKAILEKVEGYKGRDRSHYNGYNPEIERRAEIETITLKVDEEFFVLKNGKRIDCNLKDKYFDGMRINIITGNRKQPIAEIDILLDFFYPDEGYRKKCVIFDILPKTQIALEGKNIKKQGIRPDKTKTTKVGGLKQLLLFEGQNCE